MLRTSSKGAELGLQVHESHAYCAHLIALQSTPNAERMKPCWIKPPTFWQPAHSPLPVLACLVRILYEHYESNKLIFPLIDTTPNVLTNSCPSFNWTHHHGQQAAHTSTALCNSTG
eukprot:CAMPEP_0114251648 /NCGR_PEP_ID=MMETSP0058-20121206/15386_1 /TAXON_ID=36894 /ORGANISM="Pyramimonas parkeae, CCMP726" /LENGTH=115 /DNA_ID=CAMNT_0001365471 /DNA_START=701 /DNA_END=1048 /DNA_ORIENTATION=-